MFLYHLKPHSGRVPTHTGEGKKQDILVTTSAQKSLPASSPKKIRGTINFPSYANLMAAFAWMPVHRERATNRLLLVKTYQRECS